MSYKPASRIRSWSRWFYPGMRVKRWISLMTLGIALFMLGAYRIYTLDLAGAAMDWLENGVDPFRVFLPLYAMLLGGLALFALGVGFLVRSIAEVLTPDREENLGEIVYRKRALAQGGHIVTIGGGTGLGTMLRGLKKGTSNLTAIVTVTDDGGSSGRLQREYAVLPPGDIRNCLVALADNEGLMTELLQHRFEGTDPGLAGHSFGNLFLLAMTSVTGNFDEAIRATSRVLAIRGKVLPSTLDQVSLVATMADGAEIQGETDIVRAGTTQRIAQLRLLPPDPEALQEAADAILHAETVIIGPGSVFTSLIPNLLVPGIRDALKKTRAQRVYVCNVMTQPGETGGFNAADHVRAIEENAGKGLFDYVLVNTAMPGDETRTRYTAQGADVVQPEMDVLREMGYRVLQADLLNETNLVRHDPDKLARVILENL